MKGIGIYLVLFLSLSARAVTVEEAKILEAQADVDYYRSRVTTAIVLRKKAEVEHELTRKQHLRRLSLHDKKATTKEELEIAEHAVDQSALNMELMDSRIEELKAELRGAEARLEQIKGGLIRTELDERARHLRSQRGESITDELAICAVLFDQRDADPIHP